MKKIFAVILSIIMVFTLVACGSTTDSELTNSTKEKSGEDFEILVEDAFWEGTCGIFGINYSDFNMLDTVTSYISDSTTSDGYTAYYYLVKTAFDTKNAFGQKINHQVTARCYYVPDYSEMVYVTYITLDGEKILFDEEKENWLLGIGGSSSNTDNTESSTSQNQEQSKPSSKEEKPSTDSQESVNNNQNNANSEMDEVDKGLAYQDWLSNLPTLDDYEEETEDQNENSNDWTFEYEEEEEDGGDLDGIATQLPDELLEELENASP